MKCLLNLDSLCVTSLTGLPNSDTAARSQFMPTSLTMLQVTAIVCQFRHLPMVKATYGWSMAQYHRLRTMVSPPRDSIRYARTSRVVYNGISLNRFAKDCWMATLIVRRRTGVSRRERNSFFLLPSPLTRSCPTPWTCEPCTCFRKYWRQTFRNPVRVEGLRAPYSPPYSSWLSGYRPRRERLIEHGWAL